MGVAYSFALPRELALLNTLEHSYMAEMRIQNRGTNHDHDQRSYYVQYSCSYVDPSLYHFACSLVPEPATSFDFPNTPTGSQVHAVSKDLLDGYQT